MARHSCSYARGKGYSEGLSPLEISLCSWFCGLIHLLSIAVLKNYITDLGVLGSHCKKRQKHTWIFNAKQYILGVGHSEISILVFSALPYTPFQQVTQPPVHQVNSLLIRLTNQTDVPQRQSNSYLWSIQRTFSERCNALLSLQMVSFPLLLLMLVEPIFNWCFLISCVWKDHKASRVISFFVLTCSPYHSP